jgi:hypothetical protein
MLSWAWKIFVGKKVSSLELERIERFEDTREATRVSVENQGYNTDYILLSLNLCSLMEVHHCSLARIGGIPPDLF